MIFFGNEKAHNRWTDSESVGRAHVTNLKEKINVKIYKECGNPELQASSNPKMDVGVQRRHGVW